MMEKQAFLVKSFIDALSFEPTECQRRLFQDTASFITSPDHDIIVVSGYAGTGKTTAVGAIVSILKSLNTKCILLAPTGRSAKVLSSYTGQEAFTVHKHIYRQKSVGGDGFGQFSLSVNKARNTLFIVDEVSLISVSAEAAKGPSSAEFGSGDLLHDLVDFVRSGINCRLMLIGDSAQLPPIGLEESPALNRDYMQTAFNGVMFTGLTTVVRQGKQSGILHNATLIRRLISEMSENYGVGGKLRLETEGFDDVSVVLGGDLIETLSDAYAKYGDDQTIVLTRSNKRAIRYNAGIRGSVQFKEDRLVRGDRLMVVKNCYQFLDNVEQLNYIANGDVAKLVKIGKYEERYGLNFATATLAFPDYDDVEITAKVILDTLDSESPSLTYEQSNALYLGVNEDHAHITAKKKRYEAVREDPYFNALQLKYSNAITCHKSQGGQWDCVFVDNAFWQDVLTLDDLKWLYTAVTRATKRLYLVNFKELEWNIEPVLK